MKIKTFENTATEFFYVLSMKIYVEAVSDTEESYSVFCDRAMNIPFMDAFLSEIISLIEKNFNHYVKRYGADEKLADVDFKAVKRALFETHTEALEINEY